MTVSAFLRRPFYVSRSDRFECGLGESRYAREIGLPDNKLSVEGCGAKREHSLFERFFLFQKRESVTSRGMRR